jgi:hypothetical protein
MNTFDRPGFNPFGTSLLAVVLLSFAAGCMQSSIVRKDASESAVNDMDDSSPRILDPLYNAGHVDPGVALDKKMGEISSNGVYCEVCHNISASTGIGNAPFVLTPRKYGRPLKFGPFKDARSPYHDTEYSELHTTSTLCGICHNVTHPINRLPIERAYDEWRDSPYAAQGIGCQECHMTPGPDYTKNPGRAAIGGPASYLLFLSDSRSNSSVPRHQPMGVVSPRTP